ncbi:hypothetical protein E4U37_006638 [Claviceps purpurea]|nr:hypothetical protein E4U37_006638 [Claviceps purpurea]
MPEIRGFRAKRTGTGTSPDDGSQLMDTLPCKATASPVLPVVGTWNLVEPVVITALTFGTPVDDGARWILESRKPARRTVDTMRLLSLCTDT